jgi:hypothetical protein
LESVTYLDNDVARSATKSYIAAFFKAHLNGNTAAIADLETPSPVEVVTVQHHP